MSKQIKEYSSEELYNSWKYNQSTDMSYGEFLSWLLQHGELTLEECLNHLNYLPEGKNWQYE